MRARLPRLRLRLGITLAAVCGALLLAPAAWGQQAPLWSGVGAFACGLAAFGLLGGGAR